MIGDGKKKLRKVKSRGRVGLYYQYDPKQNNQSFASLNSSVLSHDHGHAHGETGGKYCESCKWKKWLK